MVQTTIVGLTNFKFTTFLKFGDFQSCKTKN